ncbi:MAG: gfo/Idh/MocA family oxidoreductase, partial [Luteolibacter sp.]
YAGYLVFKGGSHGSTLTLLDSEKARDFFGKLPEWPKSPSNHFKNFLLACKGEEKTRSPFSVAGPLCQAMELGIIAQQVNARLEFDPATRRITNHKVADALLDGPPPRKDWEQFYKL